MIPEVITPQAAVRRAKWTVLLPSVAMLGVSSLACQYFLQYSDRKSLMGFAITCVVSFTLSWLVWSLLVPRWRLWAYERVSSIPALKYNASIDSFIPSEGSIFERTEIMSTRIRRRLRELEALHQTLVSIRVVSVSVYAGGRCVGHADLQPLDTSMGVYGGSFVPTDAYSSIEPVIHKVMHYIIDTPRDNAGLKVAYGERDALGLEVRTDTGFIFHPLAVHIDDGTPWSQNLGIELELIGVPSEEATEFFPDIC